MKESDVWQKFTEVICRGFESAGSPADQALQNADIAVSALHAAYGGERVGYLPKKRQALRAAMMDEVNGKNIADIANHYAVSRATVYRQIAAILTKKQKKSHF